MTSNVFVDWNYDMDALNDEGVPEGISPEQVPENVDKAPKPIDGEQPEQPYPLTQYGVLPEEDPYDG